MRINILPEWRVWGFSIAVCAGFLFAGAEVRGQASLGVAAGLNYGSLNEIQLSNTRATFENSSGYHAGAFLDLAGGPTALRVGLFYMNAGPLFEGLSDAAGGTGAAFDFDVNFITVPIDLRFRMRLPLLMPYLLLGPELRFLTDANEDFRENMREFQVTANLGAGVEMRVPLTGITLFPELRYAFDLTGLTDRSLEIGGVTFETDREQRLRMFLLRLGVGF